MTPHSHVVSSSSQKRSSNRLCDELQVHGPDLGRVTGIHVSHLSTEKHEIPVRALESAFLI